MANVLTYLAIVYQTQARDADAEAVTMRALAIQEAALGMAHPDVATTLNNLALIQSRQGRYAEAESLYKRSLATSEAASGRNHSDLAPALANLGALYYVLGRYADAEPLMRRALSIYKTALGAEHPDVSAPLNNLAQLYRAQARYTDAEPLYKRAISLLEKAFGPNHPNVAASLGDLAELYRTQGRYGDAELLATRALAVNETVFGPGHPAVSATLFNLAVAYGAQGRYADAEPLMRRALAIHEKALGSDHPSVAGMLNDLSLLYRARNRDADAEPLMQRALAIFKRHCSQTKSPSALRSTTWRNSIVHKAGVEAEPLYRRTVSNFESALGPDHPDVGVILNNLAVFHFAQQDWGKSVTYLRRGTGITVERARGGADAIGRAPTGKVVSEAARDNLAFSVLVKAAHRLADAGNADASELAGEMFRTAQWGLGTEASASLAQMAARQAKGDNALARFVRERQDLIGEWQARDKLLIAARAEAPARRNARTEAELNQRLIGIDTRIAEIDRALAKDFPTTPRWPRLSRSA